MPKFLETAVHPSLILAGREQPAWTTLRILIYLLKSRMLSTAMRKAYNPLLFF